MGPAAMCFAVFNMNSDHKYLIISLITIGVSLTEVTMMGGFYYALMDVAPEYSGILQGIKNTVGLSTGFIVPMIVSFLTPTVNSIKIVILIFVCDRVLTSSVLIRKRRKNGVTCSSCLEVFSREQASFSL